MNSFDCIAINADKLDFFKQIHNIIETIKVYLFYFMCDSNDFDANNCLNCSIFTILLQFT